MPGRRDTNERLIIDALRAAGCTVLQLDLRTQGGVPDLLVGCPWKGNVLMEVKRPAEKLRPDQGHEVDVSAPLIRARQSYAFDATVRLKGRGRLLPPPSNAVATVR